MRSIVGEGIVQFEVGIITRNIEKVGAIGVIVCVGCVDDMILAVISIFMIIAAIFFFLHVSHMVFLNIFLLLFNDDVFNIYQSLCLFSNSYFTILFP